MKVTRLLQATSLAALLLWQASPAQPMREAPNAGATPVDQLAIAGNACGPAALLSAYRFGDRNWQRAANGIQGENDRQRLRKIILEVAMRPSKHLGGRARWSKSGVNLVDLCDMANEITAPYLLPKVGYEILFLKPGESQEQLLKRVHARLNQSLSKGLPPILSIRRFSEKKAGWGIVEGHFVTVISVPKRLEKGARSFSVTYLDPWGGKRSHGQIAISDRAFLSGKPQPGNLMDPTLSPCLEAAFPQALVGKSKVPKGEATILTVSAAIGRW